MSGSRSRRKGQRGELELAKELTRIFGVEARRGQQFSGSPDSPDVEVSIPGLHIESKRCEALHLYPALNQAKEDAGPNCPVVMHRRNGKPWVVVVELEHLPWLARLLSDAP